MANLIGSIALLGVLLASQDAAAAEDWWQVPFGPNAGAVDRLYVERHGITSTDIGKAFWISESLDPSQSYEIRKVERVEVDCSVSRYRGVLWYWTDRNGQQTMSDAADERWNIVTLGSPMEAARTFACFSPPAGSVSVPSIR